MKLIGIHGKARSGKDELCNILCQTFGFKRVAFADKVKNLCMLYYNLSFEEVAVKKTKTSRLILQGVGDCGREHTNYVCNLFLAAQHDTTLSDLNIGLSGYPIWVEKICMKCFNLTKSEISPKRKKKFVKLVLDGTRKMFEREWRNFHSVTKGHEKLIWVNYLEEKILKDPSGIYVVSDIRYKNEKSFVEENGKTIHLIRTDNPEIESGADHSSENDLLESGDWFYEIINDHKADWRIKLVQSATNLVRKLDSINFFSNQEKNKFMININ